MKHRLPYSFVAAVTCLGSSGFALSAHAQEAGTNVPTPPPSPTPTPLASEQQPSPVPETAAPVTVGPSDEPTIDTTTTRKTWPNVPLLTTGFVFLGGSYGASAIVGGLSNRHTDKQLFYPVVGPWLALHQRNCSTDPCTHETLNSVLFIGDGVLQGIGALEILLSLVVPQSSTRRWYLVGNENVVVAPQVGVGNIGLGAIGRF